MFRFQLLYRNPSYLRQLQYFPEERLTISTQFIRTFSNKSKQNVDDNIPTSNTLHNINRDINSLQKLVEEQVSMS